MDEEQKRNLLEEFDLNGLPEEMQTKMIQVMTESLLKRITLHVLEALSEEDRAEFERVKDQEDGDKTEAFLREKIPNYDELIETVSRDFKEEMKGHISELKQGLGDI